MPSKYTGHYAERIFELWRRQLCESVRIKCHMKIQECNWLLNSLKKLFFFATALANFSETSYECFVRAWFWVTSYRQAGQSDVESFFGCCTTPIIIMYSIPYGTLLCLRVTSSSPAWLPVYLEGIVWRQCRSDGIGRRAAYMENVELKGGKFRKCRTPVRLPTAKYENLLRGHTI